MHEKNIELLREEASRLLNIELEMNNKLLKEVIKESDKVRKFKQKVEAIKGELRKLENFELVVAIVGTMKAGKSTTINAIVGNEVLPNRNTAMTSIPTLIRHTVGQKTPKLIFKNHKPIFHLISEVQELLSNGIEINDLELQETIKLIKNKPLIKETFEGIDEIYEFLKLFNDLVRLCNKLEIKFPFDEYDEIHELPVIEVEFAHLDSLKQANGQLTLLDTPGPNEAGQTHLEYMIKDQLQKASVVITILDYTKLNTKDDEKLGDNLKEVLDVEKGKIFAFVNKFDNEYEHSLNKDATKHYVAEKLMPDLISLENIYPISAQCAYLANAMKKELEENGEAPDYNKIKWVEDFGKKAFAAFWEEDISNVERVEKAADRLWKKSLFQEPVEKVIFEAHKNAGLLALESSSNKLISFSKEINDLLEVRLISINKSVGDLNNQINKLKEDISSVDLLEEEIKKKAELNLNNFSDELKCKFQVAKNEAIKDVDEYFETGKQNEEELYNNSKQVDNQKKTLIDDIRKIFRKPLVNDKKSFAPNRKEITFSNHSDAQKIVENIENSVVAVIDNKEIEIKQGIEVSINKFNTGFSYDISKQIEEIKNSTEKNLEEDGFKIIIDTPSSSKLKLEASTISNKIMSSAIKKHTEDVRRDKRYSVERNGVIMGIWGWVCEGCGTTDYGWEERWEKEDRFTINIDNLRSLVDENINEIFKNLENTIEENIKLPMHQAINSTFEELKEKVQNIRQDFIASISDKKKSEDEFKEFVLCLKEFKKEIDIISSDSKELEKDIKA